VHLAYQRSGEVEVMVEVPFYDVISQSNNALSFYLYFFLTRTRIVMPVTYTQFLTLIATALRDENGLDLAHLIRPISPHGKDLVKEFRNPTVRKVVSVLPFEV